MLFNVNAIEEKIRDENSKVEAILAVASEEKRELTADEAKIVNAWHGQGDEEGELGKLEAQLSQARKIEAKRQELAKASKAAKKLGDNLESGSDDPQAKGQRVVVPARARSRRDLKAFKGENAERDAYIAGQCFAATLLGHQGAKKWIEDHGIRNAISVGDNQSAGVLVPVETETAIVRLVEEYGVARQYCNVVPMMSDRKIVPVRTAGLTAYPVAETNTNNQGSNTVTQSTPKYTSVELVARKWKAETRMSDEFSEDTAIAFAEQVVLESALAMAIAEDQCLFLGDGTSTYHGIKGLASALLAGSVYTAATGNTAFSTLDLLDFENMAGKLPDYPGIQPAWFVSKEGYFASMHRLMAASGGTTGDQIGNGMVRTFLGYPVVFSPTLNSTLTAQTSTRLLYLGDLRQGVVFGDRRGITISTTDQRYWDEDQIGIKATERFDLSVHSVGTASACGAIVALDTPGS